MLHSRILTFNPLGTNCAVLWAGGSKTCTVVDPGMAGAEEAAQLADFLSSHALTPEAILLTHGHFDHIWGVERLLSIFSVPVYLHKADKEILPQLTSCFPGMKTIPFLRHDFPSEAVEEGDKLTFSGITFQVLHTPGHTPGSVCYYVADDNLLLSGDTLFAGSIGRTDLPGGDYDELMKSIQDKLLTLPSETDVIPGHGQPTSILREATTNPFLQPFNEPDTPWWNQDGIPIQPL